MHIKYCKLSKKEQIKLMEHFVADTPARTAAEIVGVHRNTAIRYFHKMREEIALKQEIRREQFCSNIELDESYFGGVRKGKRGRGAAGKIPVFCIIKRGDQVYTQVIDDTKITTLMPIIRDRTKPDSIVYPDSYRSYNALDVSEFKHYRINHSEAFAHKQSRISGIENFWNQAKRHLRKYNGIPKKTFLSFLERM